MNHCIHETCFGCEQKLRKMIHEIQGKQDSHIFICNEVEYFIFLPFFVHILKSLYLY